MPNHLHSRLGQLLISKGLITGAQQDAAIKVQLGGQSAWAKSYSSRGC